MMDIEPRVFISYSSKDGSLAQQVYDHLRLNGIRPLKAPDDIPPGHDWPNAIVEMIQSSTFLILLWTENSMESKEVSKELTLAMGNGLQIIPFNTTGGEPRGAWRYHLANLQWLDASSRDPGLAFQELVKQILPSNSIIKQDLQPTTKDLGVQRPIPKQVTRSTAAAAALISAAALAINLFALLVGIWFGLTTPKLPGSTLALVAGVYRAIPSISFLLYAIATVLAVISLRQSLHRRWAVLALVLTGFQLTCYLVGGLIGILPR